MIVICEHCETRFKLDEGRIPPEGTRVRCSRCKHAFFLPAPGGDEPDLLDELVRQTAAEPLRAPQPTEDLSGGLPPSRPAAADSPRQQPPIESAPSASPWEIEGNESDWEFSDHVPGDGPADGSLGLSSDDPPPATQATEEVSEPSEDRPAPGPEIRQELEEDELSWDFEGEDLIESATPPRAPSISSRAPAEALASSPVGPETPSRSAPPQLLEAPEGVGWLLEATGWLATAVFVGLVTVKLLLPATPAGPVSVSEHAVGPLVAGSVRGRFVENLFVGPLLVVTADLHNPGDEPSSLGAVLRAVLLDAEGNPVAGSKAALAPAAEGELREQPPEVLAARLAERARALSAHELPPGARLGVTAVFPAASGEAVGLSLEMDSRVTYPRQPVEATPAGGRSPPAH